MAVPTMMPAMVIQGFVSQDTSAQNPNRMKVTVGTNILHVVSAMVPSNKMTVDGFGGLGVPADGSSGSLMYTRYSTRNLREIPTYATAQ